MLQHPDYEMNEFRAEKAQLREEMDISLLPPQCKADKIHPILRAYQRMCRTRRLAKDAQRHPRKKEQWLKAFYRGIL